MGIVVKQFNGSSVTPKDDAVVNELIFQSYGIFDGCGISFLGINQLMVNSGRMIIKGRQVVITEETIAAQLSSGGTKKGRLYIRMDLSSPDTPAVFLTQVADELPALTQQDDVNYNDGIFEVELCNYNVSETAISNIVESCPLITGSMDMIKTVEELMANTEPGKTVDALLVKQVNESLQNENNESFNFGYKDGVRGFFTNPSRADDSFIPFSNSVSGEFVFVATSKAHQEINLGFRPSSLVLTMKQEGKNRYYAVAYANGLCLHTVKGDSVAFYYNQEYFEITDTGFKMTHTVSNDLLNATAYYVATK